MSWQGQEEKEIVIAKRAALPKEADERNPVERSAYYRAFKILLKRLLETCAPDAKKLIDGGVNWVKGRGDKQIAEAEERLANAAKLHADKEEAQARAKASIMLAKAEDKKADAELVKANADLLRAQAEAKKMEHGDKRRQALDELEDAIRVISMRRGQVSFDIEQLKNVAKAGAEENPNDPLLNESND